MKTVWKFSFKLLQNNVLQPLLMSNSHYTLATTQNTLHSSALETTQNI